MFAGAFALIAIGDITTPHSGGPSTFLEWAGIVLMTAACAAMLIAWRWEFVGAALSLISIVAIAILIHGSRTFHLAILTMAVPGILYFVDFFARHQMLKTGQGDSRTIA